MDEFTKGMTRKVVIDAILARCHSVAEVQELLYELTLINNWEDLIAERELENRQRPCSFCSELKDVSTFQYILGKTGAGLRYRGACPDCVKKLDLRVKCVVCQTSVLAYCPVDNWVCRQCEPAFELVRTHLSRAKQLSLPADLTTKQWLQALQHFNQRCAYCSGPFECLEHYVPLTRQGGTTARNCIPACTKCNVRKKDLPPHKLDTMFPAENLARIRSWLQQ